jgi:hypothetical protein
MYIGQSVIIRYNNKVEEGRVIRIFSEELEIELTNKEIVLRKFWEVRKIKNEE